jgi:hypothetical protein
MKTTLLAIATGLAFLTQPVAAGGPVIVEDTTETVAPDRDNGWVVPVVIGLLIIGAIASGGGDGVSVDTPDDGGPKPCPKVGSGC